ncbi:MAG: phosphate ABC transporter permease subunit PstC [Acidimicrobiales bacterium]
MATTNLPPGSLDPAEALAGNSRRQAREKIIKGGVAAAAFTSILISFGIVGSLIYRAAQFVGGLLSPGQNDLAEASEPIGLSNLWSDQWAPRFFEFDVKTLLFGSIIVTIVAMAVATPIGLGAAVYLSEYASPRVRKILKPILEVLAGIPSVVLGFFALRWISPNLVQKLFDAQGQSLLAAGLGVGLLTIPLVASISEDAMRSVPNALRQASSGLGARKKTTTLSVVVPAAVSGLVAALIVATSRAIGETMVVFIAAGASGNSAQFTVNPLERGSTMTAAMASQASGTDGTISELGFNSLFFVGFVLFVITLILNLVADRFVRKVRQAY